MLDGRRSFHPKLLIILSIAVLILLVSTQKVYAVGGGTVDVNTCASTFGGTWDGADSCTITSGITVSSGETLTIPNGVNLVLSNSQGTGITLNSGGTLSNSGTITVANTDGSYGIQNNYGGTLSSSGTIRVSNNGGIGIVNFGSLSNSGTMTVSNSGSTGIANSGGGMLTNNPGGTIVVSNTGSDTDGIGNSGSLSNLGTITVSNTGYIGIIQTTGGTLSNLGTITVSNTGTFSYGIQNNYGGTLSNSGTITVANSGSTGIYNFVATLSNSGTITLSNTGPIAIHNSDGTLSNSGTITVSNTGSIGIYNEQRGVLNNNPGGTIVVSNSGGSDGISNSGGTIINSGIITLSNTGVTGIYNSVGDSLTNNAVGTITVSNSGSSYGIYSGGTVTNFGTITVSNTGTGTGSYGIYSYGTLSSSGTIIVENSGYIGIYNGGTFTNSGSITVSNTGTASYGIAGDLSNFGTITVSNRGTGSYGIRNSGGTLSNSGAITVSNTGSSTGILNDRTFTNSAGGTITASNSGSYGIQNHGTFSNSGTITVSNSGSSGITIYSGGTFSNSGTITVANIGIATFGIQNFGSLSNSGAITVSNTGSGSSGIVNFGMLTNNAEGTTVVSNTGGTGIYNAGTLSNPGTITICGGTTYGTIPTSGNPVTTCNAPPTVSITGLPVTLEATGPSGAVATFTASATSSTGVSLSTTCSPVSGSTFSLGATTVTCTATDALGNTGSVVSTVTVVDTTLPILSLPADIIADATSPSGASLTFSATATDLADSSPVVACSPPSGSTFALGATPVSCSATDSSGNVASGIFTVTVNPALTVDGLSAGSSTILSGRSSTLSATFGSGTSPYSCQWLQKSPGAGSYSNLDGSSSSSCTSPASTSTGALTTVGAWSFEIQVTDNVGAVVTSSPVIVNVYDFTATLSSADAILDTILRGGQGSYTVTLTLTSGSTGTIPSIALSISGLTGSFFPASLVPSGAGKSTFLRVNSPATVGDTSFTVTGTDGRSPEGGARASASTTLHVYDFTLTITSPDTVLKGGSGVYTIKGTLVTGSTGTPLPFGLTVSGVSGGFSSPTQITPTLGGVTSMGTVTPGSVGDALFTVTAANGSPAAGARTVAGLVHVYDFTVAGSSADTILYGGKGSYIVTLTLVSGSTGIIPSVSLSISTMSGSFSSLSVTPTFTGATSTLTVNSPLTVGDRSFTVTGTDGQSPEGGTRSSASIAMHVYDFAIHFLPPDTILLGGKGSYTVTASLVSGSTGDIPSVSLSISGLTGSFGSTSLVPTTSGASSTLTVDSPATVGDALFTVTGTDSRTPEGGTRNIHSLVYAYDFKMAVSSADTILLGGRGSYTATLTLVTGSGGTIPSVTLSINTLTGLFSSSVTPTPAGAASTLSVNSPASVGDSSFTVTGTDSRSPEGGSRVSSPSTIHVYDFTVSVSPTSSIFLRGATGTHTVTLTLATGSTGTVPSISLTQIGLPGDSTYSFSGSVIPTTSGASATLTVVTDGSPLGSLGDRLFIVAGSDSRSPEGGSRISSTNYLRIYDFSVSLSPSDSTVLRGASASYTLSVSLTIGSTSTGLPTSVSMSLTGAPSDSATTLASSIIFPPSPVSPAATVLNIGTGSTSLGDFALTVRGSVAGGYRSGSGDLHVYDFGVSVSSGTKQINQGSSASYMVTLTLLTGSSSTGIPSVGLSVGSCVSDATCTFTPVSVVPTASGATSTLAVTTGTGTTLGTYTITVTASDSRSPEGGSRTGSATLVVGGTSLVYAGPVAADYGDLVTLSATLTSQAGTGGVPNEVVTFYFNGQSIGSGTTSIIGVATLSWNVGSGFSPQLGQGTYSICAKFSGDSSWLASQSATQQFRINNEDTVVTYTGNTVLSTTSSSFTLQGLVLVDGGTEPYGPFRGNLMSASVQFKVYTTTLTPTLLGAFYAPVSTVSGLTGTATTTLPCRAGSGSPPSSIICGGIILQEGAYNIQARIDPTNAYFTSPVSDGMFSVYIPTGQFVTAGGWVADPSSLNPKNQANFGLTVRFNSKGQIQGQSVYIYRTPCVSPAPTGDICDIMIKSNAWIGLGFYTQTVGGMTRSCSNFQSKANVQETDTVTGILYSVQGNNQMTVYACQGNSNSSPAGTYSIQDLSQSGTVFHATPGYSTGVVLGGGSVVVHNNAFTPTISLSPSTCDRGARVTVSGTGFAPLSTITIAIGSTVFASVTSDSAGSFATGFTAPLTSGTYTVIATDGSGNSAWATLTVS